MKTNAVCASEGSPLARRKPVEINW